MIDAFEIPAFAAPDEREDTMRKDRYGSTHWTMPIAAIALLLASAARGQDAGTNVPDFSESPDFGTSSPILQHTGFAEFVPGNSGDPFTVENASNYWGRSSTSPISFYAHPHIPTGARLVSLELDFCDNDPTLHLLLNLVDCDLLGGDCNSVGQITSTNLGVTRCGHITQDLTATNYTMQNGTRQLVLRAFVNSGTTTNIMLGTVIGYRLQVSAAPAVATFTDVPTTSPQFRFVEALVGAGITAGCGGGNYCPDAPITRGQMAVFLASALGLHFPN